MIRNNNKHDAFVLTDKGAVSSYVEPLLEKRTILHP